MNWVCLYFLLHLIQQGNHKDTFSCNAISTNLEIGITTVDDHQYLQHSNLMFELNSLSESGLCWCIFLTRSHTRWHHHHHHHHHNHKALYRSESGEPGFDRWGSIQPWKLWKPCNPCKDKENQKANLKTLKLTWKSWKPIGYFCKKQPGSSLSTSYALSWQDHPQDDILPSSCIKPFKLISVRVCIDVIITKGDDHPSIFIFIEWNIKVCNVRTSEPWQWSYQCDVFVPLHFCLSGKNKL